MGTRCRCLGTRSRNGRGRARAAWRIVGAEENVLDPRGVTSRTDLIFRRNSCFPQHDSSENEGVLRTVVGDQFVRFVGSEVTGLELEQQSADVCCDMFNPKERTVS